ncbi:hypothetical protein ACFJIX_02465 [Roseateles sp. UC29_93]|uniref:hypothetical protein n=1 Tax=Roseateles sp. UC29_93 TaxID=3350177 RepID=UPI00366EEAC3
MRFPVVLRYMQTLVVADEDYFSRFGKLDLISKIVETNLTKSGEGGYHWLIDADGYFHQLTSTGIVRNRLTDKLLLRRTREAYRIEAARKITGTELLRNLEGLKEPGDDLHFVQELRELASNLGDLRSLDRELMQGYLGE